MCVQWTDLEDGRELSLQQRQVWVLSSVIKVMSSSGQRSSRLTAHYKGFGFLSIMLLTTYAGNTCLLHGTWRDSGFREMVQIQILWPLLHLWVVKSFVSDLGVSCLLPAFINLLGTLVDLYSDKVLDASQFLTTNVLSIFNFKHGI